MKVQAFDFSIDVIRSLLWRHNEAENLQAILQNKQAAMDELNQDFWESWFDDVFNLDTANSFGLSVWSIILDISLTVGSGTPEIPNSNFGFGSFRKNFNNGNFTNVGDVVISDDDARILLKLRYYQLVTRGTIPECNKIVADVFSDFGLVFALDGYDMTMAYIFEQDPPLNIKRLLEDYDLLPRPSGVGVRVVYAPNSAFGFGGFRKNFNNGNFRA